MTSHPPTQTTAAEQAMAATAIPILEYGRAWMSAPETAERASALGLQPGFGFWVHGRAGVLGTVDADVAAGAIGFMAPSEVRRFWDDRPAGKTPEDMAAAYADAAAAWGRQTLSDVPEAELLHLADLCDKISAAAAPSTGVLFAGWRALEQPTDPAGRVTVALNVLRELRGGAHLSAVNAAGLGPHGAIISTADPVRGGAPGAERFGWTEPHPVPNAEARQAAEIMTTEICRPAYEALTEAESQQFADLVATVRNCVTL